MPPQDPQQTTFDFSSIPGHQQHSVSSTGGRGVSPTPAPAPAPEQTEPEPSIGPIPESSLGEKYVKSLEAPLNPIGAAGDAWNSLRDELRAHQHEHPLLGSTADKMDALQEMMFGGQSVGKPMGTSGGVADEANILAGAADAPEMVEGAVEKGLSAARDSEFLKGVGDELGKWASAKTPVGREAEAGRVTLDFSSIPGHQQIPENTRVFHGTKAAPVEDITSLSAEHSDPRAVMGPGVYVTEDPAAAGHYAGPTSGPATGGRVVAGKVKADTHVLDANQPLPKELWQEATRSLPYLQGEPRSYADAVEAIRHENPDDVKAFQKIVSNEGDIHGVRYSSGGRNAIAFFGPDVSGRQAADLFEPTVPSATVPAAPNEQSTASAQKYNESRGLPPIDHTADELPSKGAIDPRTGTIDKTGYGVEVFPEARAAREPLSHAPTKQDVEGFYNDHKELFDRHPQLRVGWDKTAKGWELNIGAAAANQAGAELVGRNLDQRAAWDIAQGQEIPTGGKGEKTKFGQYPLEDRLADLSGKNVAKLPPTIKNSPHLTDPEKYLLASDAGALKGFKDTKKKIASVQELAETAKAGEANRFWYDRARASFNTMFNALPKGSFPAEDRDKFIGLVAATSPRSDVVENLAASLSAYRAWVEEGRPTDPIRVREAVDSSLMMPSSHGPNAARALTGQELSGPKVTSFLKNFMGSQQHVTNDMWGALTNGIMDAKELSNPGSYIALSENYRKAAESLGWSPQQAQAASWGFVRTLGNMAGFGGKQAGADKPAAAVLGMIDDPTVRKYSADIADIFLTSAKVRDRLEQLGINLEDFDARLRQSIEPYGRGGEGQTRGTNPKLLARTAEKVEEGKRYVRAQAAAGKNVNEKAMPLLEGTLGKESGPKKPRKR